MIRRKPNIVTLLGFLLPYHQESFDEPKVALAYRRLYC